jgi:hypothetical protein
MDNHLRTLKILPSLEGFREFTLERWIGIRHEFNPLDYDSVKTSETTGCQRGTELYFSKYSWRVFLSNMLADFLQIFCPSAASTIPHY